MTRRQYKITPCNILQTDFQSSPHDLQYYVNPPHPTPHPPPTPPPPPHPPPSPHTQHDTGDPNIRAIASKCTSGSKASVSFPNDSFLPLHRSLCFMVERTSVAQEVSSSVTRSTKN